MKRIWMLILALCLALTAAAADPAVTELQARNVELNAVANTLLVEDENRNYHVADLSGQALSGDYAYARIRDGMYFVTKETEYSGSTGVLDGQGKQVLPEEYFNADVISDRWVIGQRWVESTSENYDASVTTLMSDAEKKYYLIDTVDVFYAGEKKGTLTRKEYNSAEAYGDYLCVRDLDGNYTFFNKEMEKSPFAADGNREYSDDYKTKTVTHQGSGQVAFAPGCTLTPEEVREPYWVAQNKTVLDLQGNVTADLSAYDSVYRAESGLVKVRNADGLYGVADVTGRELVPCLYSEVGYDLPGAKAVGYIYAVRDGKAGFVSLADGSEAGFEFPAEAVRAFAAWLKVEDKLNGVTYAVSAAAGRLEGSWKDISAPYSGSGITGTLATVETADGFAGVIGQHGEEIIPADGTIANAYNLKISNDGKVILTNPERGVWRVYRLDEAK